MLAFAPPSSKSADMLHALRLTRDESKSLGIQELTRDELQRLAEQNIGLFAGGFPSCDAMMRKVAPLADASDAHRWCVACSSKAVAENCAAALLSAGMPLKRDGKKHRWRLGNLALVTVEGLKNQCVDDLAGVILIDPLCHIHKAREFQTFNGRTHDRPQIVVNCLADAATLGSPAVLCVFTQQSAKSLSTARIAEIYMQSTWWFLDPMSIRFWK